MWQVFHCRLPILKYLQDQLSYPDISTLISNLFQHFMIMITDYSNDLIESDSELESY